MAKETIILKENIDRPELVTLEGYKKLNRGGEAWTQVLRGMTQDQIIDEVKKSNIRGRGGAGFPMGMKWSFVNRKSTKPIYLCCNADEGEPGTFKDRLLLEKSPHGMIEGMAIASFALGVHNAYIYLRGEFMLGNRVVNKALEEWRKAGWLGKNIMGSGFDLDIVVHRGAGAYICGEETALINSLEGKRGEPRLKPPFPAVVGLYDCPTVVNNVETLQAVPWIILNGGDAYAKLGTEKSKGTKLMSASGHIKKPGVYEIEMGMPMMDFLNDLCGGIRDGHRLKACIPGGSSVPIMTAEDCAKANLDYESLTTVGSMLGSGGIIFMDETTDIAATTWNLASFYAHESCGQCTPCREGTTWARKLLERICKGEGSMQDLDTLMDVANGMDGTTICPLGPAAAWPIQSALKKFRPDFENKIRAGAVV